MDHTDVLIGGGGPGGSAAAYHLARQGIDVTLIEKATFPREKVCGDGLTPRAVAAMQQMGIDTADPRFERVIGLQVVPRQEHPQDLLSTLLYVCDEGSAFLTGQTINVDGGSAKH